MNILILEDTASTKHGGAEKSMFCYCLLFRNTKVNLYLAYDKSGDWLEGNNAELFTNTVQISVLPITVQGIGSYLMNLTKLVNFCRKNKIEKVFTHVVHGFPMLNFLELLLKIEIIVFFKWRPNTQSIGKISKWATRCIYKAAASTDYLIQYWERNTRKDLIIEKIPDGIKIERSPNVQVLRPTHLLYIGRIYEGKGVHLLIKSLVYFPQLTLSVAGVFNVVDDHEHREYHKYLLSLLKENSLENRVNFLGYIKNTAELMKEDSLVVIPSIWPENQNLVLLEAMGTKTSVLASKFGGTPEVVGEFGKQVLFEPTLNDLVSAVGSVLAKENSFRQDIVQGLFDRFISEYSIAITHNRLNKLLRTEG